MTFAWALAALLCVVPLAYGQEELGIDYTCTPEFSVYEITIPEICFEAHVNVCEEELSIFLELDGDPVIDESVDEFDDFELCYPLDDSGCEICIRTYNEVTIAPEFVEVCLESFSRCTEWGVDIEYGETDLGCIEQGQECIELESCGACADAGCGWCGDTCLPVQHLGPDEIEPFCDSCSEGLVMECEDDPSAIETGEQTSTGLSQYHVGDTSLLIAVIAVGGAVILVLLVAVVCLVYRRKSQRRFTQAHTRIQAIEDLPDAIDLNGGGDNDLTQEMNYAPPSDEL